MSVGVSVGASVAAGVHVSDCVGVHVETLTRQCRYKCCVSMIGYSCILSNGDFNWTSVLGCFQMAVTGSTLVWLLSS